MGDDSIKVTATTVRVPVFVSHSEAINIQTKSNISSDDVRDLLKNAPGVKVIDDPSKNKYPTPAMRLERMTFWLAEFDRISLAKTASSYGALVTTYVKGQH